MAEDSASVDHIPEFFVSGVQNSSDGKDFQILFSKRKALHPLPDEPVFEPAVCLNMSRGTAADLHASLGNILEQLARDFGPITTAYLEERKAPSRKRAVPKGRKKAK